jgi:hypothetical protein
MTTTLPIRPVLAALIACVAVAAPHSEAGPPLITDDPDTPGKDHWEINLAYTLDVSARATPGGRTWEHAVPLLDLNYGLFENDQLKLEMPLLILDPADHEGTSAGVGDALLGYKLRLLDDDKSLFSLSIYPQVGLPTGDRDRDLGTGGPSLKLPVQVGRHLFDDKLFLYADLGYKAQFAADEPDSWSAGVAAEYSLCDYLTLCGELRHTFGVRGAPDDSLFNLGLKWRLGDSASLLAAVGRSFDPGPESGSALLAYVGVQFSF